MSSTPVSSQTAAGGSDRAPGADVGTSGVAELAELLRETAEHHDHYEKTHAEHNWWDWYAPYLDARQHGDDADAAVTAANRYMDEVKQVPAR